MIEWKDTKRDGAPPLYPEGAILPAGGSEWIDPFDCNWSSRLILAYFPEGSPEIRLVRMVVSEGLARWIDAFGGGYTNTTDIPRYWAPINWPEGT